jgi:hypothetical protein
LKTKVCHISTVHPCSDIRIFEKECQTLSCAGYRVFFIVPNQGNEEIRGVTILALPMAKYRFARAFKNGVLAFCRAKNIKADVYHFHDPELIFFGFLLSLYKKKVIYDVHENVPLTILNKDWIPGLLRGIISLTFEKLENWCARRMNLLITATPAIRDRFLNLGCRAVDINNFPIIQEFRNANLDWNRKERAVCFVGAMDRYRGIVEMIQAVGKTNGKLFLAGTFSPASHRSLVSHLDGWKQVEEMGQLDRSGVAQVLGKSMAGLVLLNPRLNYLDSLPIKMFEYMSAGIPVIASNFPLWQKIIQEERCGLCCDPLNPEEIAQAIHWVFDHPDEAKMMGERGRKAVHEKYNWEAESKKLLDLYEEILQ